MAPARFCAGSWAAKNSNDRLYQRTSVSVDGLLVPIATGATKDESASPEFEVVSFSSFEYALGKYGDRTYVWYVGGLEAMNYDSITLPETVGNGKFSNGVEGTNSISHLSFYHGIVSPPGVPDSGSTIAFAGLSFAALALARRKL